MAFRASRCVVVLLVPFANSCCVDRISAPTKLSCSSFTSSCGKTTGRCWFNGNCGYEIVQCKFYPIIKYLAHLHMVMRKLSEGPKGKLLGCLLYALMWYLQGDAIEGVKNLGSGVKIVENVVKIVRRL